MKKILLTGGNGFIGKNIQESFLSEKYEIYAPRSFELNLLDTESVDKYFEDRSFDVVLHAAVKPGHRNAKDPTNLFYSNLRMFESLERKKDKFKKFINFGSGAIYDISKNITQVREKSVFDSMPSDEHGFCKYVEQKQIEQLDSFINLNIFGIFGKYEDWEIRFISNAICKTLYDLPVTLRQNRRFSYLFIDDLMLVLDYMIQNDMKYKTYNIVPDEELELYKIAEIIQEISGKNTGIAVSKGGYGLDYTGCNKRLKQEIPDLKFTKIEQSIELLYNYYRDNLDKINRNLLLEDK
ncbi:MAG: NAD-dependent epimerase/dehydratase family protein [Clostridium sp.]|nr:NAD-dependent epimerase/dehydratase family protein [Clostridium sp.]